MVSKFCLLVTNCLIFCTRVETCCSWEPVSSQCLMAFTSAIQDKFSLFFSLKCFEFNYINVLMMQVSFFFRKSLTQYGLNRLRLSWQELDQLTHQAAGAEPDFIARGDIKVAKAFLGGTLFCFSNLVPKESQALSRVSPLTTLGHNQMFSLLPTSRHGSPNNIELKYSVQICRSVLQIFLFFLHKF